MKTLFSEKIEILRQALELTDDLTFTGNSDDADLYIEFIEKRNVLFTRAKAIDAQLSAAGYRGTEPEMAPFKKQISALAKSIIERDNYMSENVSQIFAGLKKNVQNINISRNINNVYSDASNLGRSRYDWSK